jgi:putative DNA primase/helicase
MYDQGRFFTVTGNRFPGAPAYIADYDARALYAQIDVVDPRHKKSPQSAPTPGQPRLASPKPAAASTSGGLIAKSFPDSAKFDALMRGEYSDSDYPSPSEAVQALCCMLAIRNNNDPGVIDQKFRASGLFKDHWVEKWERRGEEEIKNAIKLVGSSTKTSLEQSTSITEPAKLAAEMGLSIDETETGNSRKLVAAYGDGLRWCPETDRWFVWDGKQWKRGDKKNSAVMLLMKKVVQQMKEEADAAFNAALLSVRPFQDKLTKKGEPRADIEEPMKQDELKAIAQLKAAAIAKEWALDSEAAHALRAAVSLAGSEPGMTRRLDQFDSDPLLLNCQNGVLDLRTIELRPHSSADFCSRICTAEYRPEALGKFPTSRFAKFLQEIQPAQSERDYLQLYYGSILSGLPARSVLVETGQGFNGKGVLKDVALSILGRSPDGYGLSAMFSSFVSTKFTKPDAPRNDLVRWAGARFVTASESNNNQKLDSALLKMFTGGDQITYRGNFEEERESAPTAKIVLLTNFLPRIDDSSEAMWGRVKNCVFPVSIPESQRDARLSDSLFRNESDIIFSWMIEGWRKYWTALDAGQNPLPDSPTIIAEALKQKAHSPWQIMAA